MVVAGSVAFGGCGSGTRLLSPAPHSPSASTYLAELSAEQQKLATAERRIPTHASSPAALSRSIDLLAAAIQRLTGDLAAIKPPSQVAALHLKLVGIVRTYHAQLQTAGREALQPGGELRAGNLLISSTDTASATFSSTVAQINARLGR